MRCIIGELQRGKIKASIAREMGMTKSCGTDIARKVARLGSERSLKDSLRAGGLRASLDKQAGCQETCQRN